MNTKKNSKRKWIVGVILFITAITLFCTSIFGNVFSLIIEKEYFIPKQSSIFTFNETIGNEGSSDVWRYGEDYSNYYYNLSTFDNDVLFFPKKNINNCPGLILKMLQPGAK
ncbi:hypothetical protein PQ462_07380 [Flavobacterium sp. KACC 22758]|uniref:hypothetical protein n=1 Tax=Flavobacterium sp. KACC 22758 TaxID=3025667 RepID=UPI0023657938|nr:hypothetical protein [Flavobacterium sp. KACC 22758]WDF61182.1 hypothetical protein PQ462_07380 [Flavobacterium sp. KACC 22758]